MNRRVALAGLLALTLGACAPEGGTQPTSHGDLDPTLVRTALSLSPLSPLPDDPSNRVLRDPRARRLGRFLFFDARLSGDGETACATCHDPAQGFGDGRPLAEGAQRLTRHSPTLFNVAWNRWFYWDGRVDTLWGQAAHPIEAAAEMNGSRVDVARLISSDPAMREAYEAIFGEAPDASDATRFPPGARPGFDDPEASPARDAWETMTARDRDAVHRVFANVVKSIAAYEATIVSRDSPFDAFVAALRVEDTAAIRAYPTAARRGFELFAGVGQCTLCHLGGELTDREFHNIGLSRDDALGLDVGRFEGVTALSRELFGGAGRYSDAKSGRHNDKLRFVVQKENNLGEFKTPTLRSVALTAPYMHDGRFDTLARVVEHYSTLDQKTAIGHREESLVPFALTDDQVVDLVAFLESLTGAPLPATVTEPPSDPRLR